MPASEAVSRSGKARRADPDTCFQNLILKLQAYWAGQGCVLLQPYDMEVGAGTFHPATTLRALGPGIWNCAYVQPSRRPADGRYGDNPNRLQHYYQYQVLMKPSPPDAQGIYLGSLEAVSIRDPERVYDMYPHEVSGGMGQRIMIAMMMIPDPKILIADEPTSALDVSVQMQVLEIMDRLVRERGMGLIFISHDLNLVSTFCDRVLIMYGGKIVETCKADRLHEAQHPYTKGLLNSLPRLDAPRDRLDVLTRDPAWRDQPSVSGVL